MRIAFFVPYPEEGPSSRFRIYQYLPILRNSGIQGDVFSFLESREYKHIFNDYKKTGKLFVYLRGVIRRWKQLRQIRYYDTVFVQKYVCPFGMYFERMVTNKKKLIVYDFDDADFLKHDSAVNSWSALLRSPAKTAKMIQRSHLIIAGNSYLAGFAKKYNDNVHIIPTSIDTEKYRPKQRASKSDLVVIGWIGSSASSRYLSLLDGVFTYIINRYRNIKIMIVGSKDYEVPDSRIILKPWTLESELSSLHSIDIGLMPLTNDDYAKGKCGFKALQYMAVGTPAVVSAVGVNQEIVRDGTNGFVARNSREWVEKIGTLIENAELRKRMGLAARKTVEKKYSVKENAAKLVSVLKNLEIQNRGNSFHVEMTTDRQFNS